MAETHAFQSDIAKLLRLLSQSLYQNREVAIRELVSNASDALDKYRLLSLREEGLPAAEDLQITVTPDAAAGTLTIADNGVGMTHDDLIENLGTIARSGTEGFSKGLEGADADSLIGQFGVGFYAAFMLAETVEVRTRHYSEERGWRWTSAGTGSFTIDELTGDAAPPERGTEIVLHLRDDAKDFTDPQRVEYVLKKYSSFVPHPIHLAGADGETLHVNDQPPVWVEPKGSVTAEQHRQFFGYLSGQVGGNPLWNLHLSLDSPLEIKSILYCPPLNPERMGLGRAEHGLHLCARRVLVQSDCDDLLPEYLRFLYGLVDSSDLPLNVSRQALQDDTVFLKIRKVLTSKVLGHLAKLAESEPKTYAEFYEQFGSTLREGVATDPLNREKIADLLRFRTIENPGEPSGLKAYVEGMKEGQTQIFHVGGRDAEAVKRRPTLEAFTARGLDVLLLTDPVDEIVLNTLGEYDGKQFVSVESAEADLPPLPESEDEKDDRPEPAAPAGLEAVLGLFRDALGEETEEIRQTDKLTGSPCRLVTPGGGLSPQLQSVLGANDKNFKPPKRILEVNPRHPLIRRLADLSVNDQNGEFIKTCGRQLFDNALLMSGMVPDPTELASRAEQFMAEAAGAKSSVIL
ncbi:molecular chaperone HtpG [Alienimonas sp. DA493]|uniref:molecular chaperone HtpG n=1 Tax=Alienimonas sp. DA493 TaxID=3373605 RepID=UPI0037545586